MALPHQKTLLSAQLCELAASPPASAGSADVSAEKSQRDFFDGLRGEFLLSSFFDYCRAGFRLTFHFGEGEFRSHREQKTD